MDNTKELLAQMWSIISEAATPPGNGFTLMNLATIGLGGEPKARSVILREFLPAPERLGFATHAWSEKVAEIRANPAVAVTCYDRERSVQLRAEGIANVVDDDADRWRAWQRLTPQSQHPYVSRTVPGEPGDADGDTDEDPSTAFQRFAWISVKLQRLDWLDLTTAPHQRWRFDQTNHSWRGRRVIP